MSKNKTPLPIEDDPDFAAHTTEGGGKVFVRTRPSKPSKRKRCAGCRKRREALAAAKKAYDENKPFTMKERIEAARKAFEAKREEQRKDGS